MTVAADEGMRAEQIPDFDAALAELEAILDGRGQASRRDRPEPEALTHELLGT